MIARHCPHEAATPAGSLCARCEQMGAAVVEIDPPDTPGAVVFETSPAAGLSTGDLRGLIGAEAADAALVERKLLSEDDLEEAGLEPYEEDPEAAERQAYEGELAWRLNERLTEVVGDRWGRANLVVVPEKGPSWAAELLGAGAEEVREVLAEQGTPSGSPRPQNGHPMLFRGEGDHPEETADGED